MQLQVSNIGYGAATILAVANGQLPEYIYKFCPINDNLHNAIRDSYIWFCSYKEFNDPFDCQHQLETKASPKEIQAYLKFAYSSTGRTVNREYFRKQVQDCIRYPRRFHKTINESLTKVISQQYLACFSMVYDNLLLWAHYTNKHTGVCLCYGLPVVASDDFIPFKVEYKEDYPYLNYIKSFNDRSSLALETLGRKSIDWEYEKELRIVSLKYGINSVRKKSLVKVIFGCRASQEDIYNLIKTVKNSKLDHVKFEKAIKEETKYALRFESIQ